MNLLPSSVAPQSNLVVTNVSAPGEADLYSTLTVSWTVRNDGSAPTTSNFWYDSLYFSLDTSLGDEDWFLGYLGIGLTWDENGVPSGNPYNFPLNPGDGYTATVSLSLRDPTFWVIELDSDRGVFSRAGQTVSPASVVITIPHIVSELAGPGYLIVKANAGPWFGSEPESTEEDNSFVLPLNIHAPDLTITEVTAPVSGFSGQEVSLSWSVKNVGSVATRKIGGWRDNVVFSRNDVYGDFDDFSITGDSGWWGMWAETTPLEPNQTYTLERLVTLPSAVMGSGYLLFKTDVGDWTGWQTQAEWDETNNVFSVPIHLDATNLAITAVSAPDVVVAKHPIDISWSVKNVGPVMAAPGLYFGDRIKFSRNDIYGDEDDVFLADVSRFPTDGFHLAPGESYVATASITLPRSVEGQGFLWVETDCLQVLAETDDTDNGFFIPITVLTPVNTGGASFTIAGTAAVGNTVSAVLQSPDPDGNGTGPLSYAWQTSSDGSLWSVVSTAGDTYTLAPADEGKRLRVVVSYTDALDFDESVSSAPVTVPPLPRLAIRAASAARMEGNIGSTPFAFTITRSIDLSGTSYVPWTVSGTGSNPANALDFVGGQLPSGFATFAPGEDTVTVLVNVVGDGTLEADESFQVILGPPSAMDGPLPLLSPTASEVTALIQNDDLPEPTYSLSASADTVMEGEMLRVGVTTTNVTPGRSVFWQLGGTGIKASDFSERSLVGATIIGADGRASFSTTLADDTVVDPDERLEVRLFSDAARTQQVGTTLRVTVKERSVGVITDGSDNITGTAAGEILTGVPAGSGQRGRGTVDRLTGGGGDDLFVLGDAQGSYYNDGLSGLGTSDLAVITDFNAGDMIQLHGASSSYRLVAGVYNQVRGVRIQMVNGATLPLPGGGSTALVGDEAIGFVQGATLSSLNLSNSTQFLYTI